MQTIGQKLKQAREAKRLTLEKVFEATRIRVPFLQALESDDLSAMPSPVQARGYLRNYAEFLGLNFDQMLDEMRAQNKPFDGLRTMPSDAIIAPMDSTPSSATQTPEPAQPQEATLPSPPKPFGQTHDKSARRKKTDSQPRTDADLTPKRRARKKVDPQPEPVLESQPEMVEEQVVEIESDLVVEEILEPQQGEKPQQESSESLWQTWLNRLTPKRKPIESDNLMSETQPADKEIHEQPAALQSTGIFKEIGVELRKRREMLSLHLDEVERNTHVKAHYLDALENGAMDNLPSTVQTRGMLSNYAAFLDLDVDSILLRFADALQARHREKNPQKPARQPGQPIVANIPPFRSFIAGDIIFGIGIAVLLVGFSVWGISRVMAFQSQQEVQPTAPSISDVLLATTDPSLFTPTATFAPVEEGFIEPTVTIVIPTQNLNVNVQVNLIAVERTFMRVTVDGEEVFNGRVMPGNAYPFEAETQVEVLVGSGAAIRVVYNGRDLGLMGAFGQVVNTIYREGEIVTPTALPTQIPTNTLTPTATVPATQTPIPSNTPVVTGTP